jgi:erythronate-4-phosphate dehydrogenase
MKIIIDDKIPYIKGALEPFASVVYISGKETTAEIAKNADAIITRTRTICNEKLLKGSSVKLIATATIGYDHIDTEYCEKEGIEWTNSPGCNSWSVAQYIMAALHFLVREEKLALSEMTIGVIGAGMVGSKVARLCEILGMKVLVNDPPRQRIEGNNGFVSLETIANEANIITIHTPLTYENKDKTYHLIDSNFLASIAKPVYLINSARGEVMDTVAVKLAIKNGKIIKAIIDCWEDEPKIDLELLGKALITTPHIAGYSRDGKANGTMMTVQAVSRKFGLGIDNWQCSGVELPSINTIELNGDGKSVQEIIGEAILFTYPIWEDSERLKASPETFEKQRGDYPVRREFNSYTIKPRNVPSSALDQLSKLGFRV